MRLGVTVFLTDQGIDPVTLATAVEERGFHALYLPEHTHLPVRHALPPSLVEGVDIEHYRRSFDPIVSLSMAEADRHPRPGQWRALHARRRLRLEP